MKPVPHGEPYAGKLHVRFDEGAGVPDNKGRPALLYTLLTNDVVTGVVMCWNYCCQKFFVFYKRNLSK